MIGINVYLELEASLACPLSRSESKLKISAADGNLTWRPVKRGLTRFHRRLRSTRIVLNN